MLPVVTFAGNLTSDPEIRFTPSGHAVANVSIACNDRVRVDGQWKDGEATFLRLTVWRKQAEHLAESCRKGDTVVGQGRLKGTKWEKDGVTQHGYDVIVDEIGPSLAWGEARTARAGGVTSADPVRPQDPWGAPTEQSESVPF